MEPKCQYGNRIFAKNINFCLKNYYVLYKNLTYNKYIDRI